MCLIMTASSQNSVVGAGGCLFCSGVSTSTSQLPPPNTLRNATRKILQELLVPDDIFTELLKSQFIQFCQSCLKIVRDVVENLKKIEILELIIKAKCEEVGKAIKTGRDNPVNKTKAGRRILGRGKIGPAQRKALNACDKIQERVVINYIKGLLPTPRVQLSPLRPQEKSSAGRPQRQIKTIRMKTTSMPPKLQAPRRKPINNRNKEISGKLKQLADTSIGKKKNFKKSNKPLNSKKTITINTATIFSQEITRCGPRVALERIDYPPNIPAPTKPIIPRVTRVKRVANWHKLKTSESVKKFRQSVEDLDKKNNNVKIRRSASPKKNANGVAQKGRRGKRKIQEPKINNGKRQKIARKKKSESSESDIFVPIIISKKSLKKMDKKPKKEETCGSRSLVPPDEHVDEDELSESDESEEEIDEDLPLEDEYDDKLQFVQKWVNNSNVPEDNDAYTLSLQDVIKWDVIETPGRSGPSAGDQEAMEKSKFLCDPCHIPLPEGTNAEQQFQMLLDHVNEVHPKEGEDVKPVVNYEEDMAQIAVKTVPMSPSLSQKLVKEKAESTKTADIQYSSNRSKQSFSVMNSTDAYFVNEGEPEDEENEDHNENNDLSEQDNDESQMYLGEGGDGEPSSEVDDSAPEKEEWSTQSEEQKDDTLDEFSIQPNRASSPIQWFDSDIPTENPLLEIDEILQAPGPQGNYSDDSSNAALKETGQSAVDISFDIDPEALVVASQQ